MCLRIMAAKPKHIKTDCVFKNVKPGSTLKWRLLRVEDEALKLCRASAVKATIRKSLRRRPKREQLAKLGKVLAALGKTHKGESADEGSPAAARVRRHPPGAMAPENTTQYLMSNAYADMKASAPADAVSHAASARPYDGSLSPRSVYAALDSDYDRSVAFQQRDFEEVYGLCC